MANTRDPIITPEEIDEYLMLGFTQNQIATLKGVSRQRISQIKLSNKDHYMTPRQRVMKHYPWKTGERFHNAMPDYHMRNHAEFMATNGRGMDERKLQRLLWFYRFLTRENVVVEFDPSIPPQEGVSSVGGFAYRPRKASDGNLIIRVNEHTKLTDEGEDLWRFPDDWPKVR